ncbi:hypothetical protein EW146_g10037 [Bondarzewia mesenterica]|uniref:Uncharacterized protein n=1 Tax=Bondarzewia mesenterica TaxID=1095465 RepID=A0A4S4L170_9AGAM|nr:hypothetical protein EW146_g10037 [Bondarzewia mesenterica]
MNQRSRRRHQQILLSRLKRLCSLGLSEDDYVDVDPQDILKTWPKFFDQVIEWLNHRILPSLHYSPNELTLGLVVNTSKSLTNPIDAPPSIVDIEYQLSYTEQQRLDRYAFTVEHAHKRKAAFDRRVISAAPGEVTFTRYDLVQIYKNALDFTLSTASPIITASFPNPTPNAPAPQNQALIPDDELTNPNDFEAGDDSEEDTDEMPSSEVPLPMPPLPLPIPIPTPSLSPPMNTRSSRTH